MRGSGLFGYRQALGGSSTCKTCLGQDFRASCQIYDNLQAAFLTELMAYLLLSAGSFIAVLCACSTKSRDSRIRVKKANLANPNHQESGKHRSCGTRQNCQAHPDIRNDDTNRDRQSNRKSQSSRKRSEASVTQVEIQNKPRPAAAAANSSSPSMTGTSCVLPSAGGGRPVVPWSERGLRVMRRLTGGLVADRSVEEMTGVVLGTFVRLVGCVQVALLPLIEDQQSAVTGSADVNDDSTNCPHTPAPLTAAVHASGPGARPGTQLPVPPRLSARK